MRDIDYKTITDAVANAYADTSNERLREILGALIPRLHKLIHDNELKPAEWRMTMDFLLKAAKANGWLKLAAPKAKARSSSKASEVLRVRSVAHIV